MECLICLDNPPKKAIVIVDDIPACQECFDCISNNLPTEVLEDLLIL